MSVQLHHVIIVTATYRYSISAGGTDDRHWIEVAREKALEVFRRPRSSDELTRDVPRGYVTDATPGWLNGVRSFAVLPSGSHADRDEADEDLAAREEFLAWLRAQSYGINEDGEYEGSPLTWVAVDYGADEHEAPTITADSDELGRSTD